MRLKAVALALAAAGSGLVAHSAIAGTLYSNGPANGTISAPSIAYGNEVADSFTLSTASTITGIYFVSWDYPTTTLNSVGYAIENAPTVPNSLTTAGITSSYLFTQANGYNIDNNAFSVAPETLTAGTYYLLLGQASGSGGYWDQNNGPSTSYGPFGQRDGSESFQVMGSSVSAAPEPSTWLLMIAGIGGIGLMLRRAKKTMGFRLQDAFDA